LKITKIEAFPVLLPTRLYRDAYGEYADYRAVIVKVVTDEKVVGWGESHAKYHEIYGETLESVTGIIRNQLAPALVGEDPFRIERAHDRMDAAIGRAPCAKTGLDLALYDIVGQTTGQPAYNLLGGKVREKVQIAIEIGLNSPKVMADEASHWVEKGLRVVKIKAGSGDFEMDMARIKAVRDAVGDKVKLRVDPNTHWSVEESKTAGRYLCKINFDYLEQPVPAWNIDGMAEIRAQAGIKVEADEGAWTVYDVVEHGKRKAADVINLKIPKVGGLSKGKKMAAVADAFGMGCMAGAEGEFAGAIAAKAHLAVSTRNAFYASDFTEVSKIEAWILNERIEMDKSGCVEAPDGPGLGVTIDEDALKKYTVKLAF
jgi:L-alanine-DL-glutamate epimerase-like enolase superfamily enzyme